MPTRSEVLRARRKAVGGSRPRCRKGKSCSAACINKGKYCLVDAPTPVAGALPRAVKAIQSRKERLGRKEQKQALQKRREYAKGRVVESAKLSKERSTFLKERNSLVVKLKMALFKADDYAGRVALEGKLKKLEEEVGSKLGVPAVTLDRSMKGFYAAQRSFQTRMADLRRKLRQAADPPNGSRPDRHLYDSIERKILSLSKKDTPFWDYNTKPMKESERGAVWKQAEEVRRSKRLSKYSAAYSKLAKQATEAAKEGNLRKYREIEAKLLKVSEKTGSKLGLQKLEKGSIWRDVRVPQALKKMVESIDKALESGDLSQYKNLEAKFLKARDKYINGNVKKSDSLWSVVGPRSLAREGEMLRSHTDILKNNLKREAYKGNRREYNKLEENLLKLDPKETKGRLWKERVREKVEEYMVSLGRDINRAIIEGNKKEYNKLERVYMRLDDKVKKGKMWQEGRIKQYVPLLLSKMEKAAASGDRKAYNRLERNLLKIPSYYLPRNQKVEKGGIWLKERGNVAINKLKDEMKKAARADDRAKYNRLEASFFRIKNKMGEDNIRDRDMRWMSRGELWREVKDKKVLFDVEDSLNKGKGENVEKISISGRPDNFTVSSRILGNSLELFISPNDSTSFMVNGSYTADPNMSRRESFAITREAMRQYGEIVSKMEDDTVFKVSAASGDGRQEMREKAYVGFGFSEPDYNGYMFGKVIGGKMTPIDEDEYYDLSS